jgi:hypothetical protein
VDFGPDAPLYREASVPTCIRPDVSAARPDASHYLTKLQILSKIQYGKIAATVRTTWISVRTRFFLKEVRNSNSTVRTPVCHGPDTSSIDMEIACRRSTVRTAIPLVWTLEAIIRKLLGRVTVWTRLSNRKDFQLKSQKFWSHGCSSGRPMSTIRTGPVFIIAVAHLNPQPINRGP